MSPMKGSAIDEDVKISYKPAEELIILEKVAYDLTKLAETCVLLINAGRPVILNWAEGVAFHHMPLPFNTKELLRERMKGRIYWASVFYASMPAYRSTLKVGAIEIPVVETPNPLLRKAARWMRDKLEVGP
ncbi:MAG: hypothetical protein JSV27_10205 [Candidatus Bathyarchaeota archaeon]|nr:MAG: hypothetical protein JSV27_10205 [Candidatus Bathyarchaeota archaeon]